MGIRDDHSKWIACTTIASRKDVAKGLRTILDDLYNAVGAHVRNAEGGTQRPVVQVIQADNAKEFLGGPFVKACQELGVVPRYSSPYAHHQQGSVERSWRSIQDLVRSQLMEARLPAPYWSHAVKHSVYLLNRIPSGDQTRSAFHTVTGRKPDLSRFKIWGCVAYRHLTYDQRAQPGDAPLQEGGQRPKKLASRADQLLYLGHAENSLSYLLCRRDEPRKIITSDAVHFAEHLITDRAPDNDVGLSSFDTAAPDGAMLTTSVNDFSVITHRTMRRRDRNAGYREVADELVAIFRIATTDHPEGIWCPAECLLENNNKGYEIVREYLLSYAESHKNALYPVF